MSHKVSYYWFRRTQYITSIGLFYKNVGNLWRVSDCEEIVGSYSQEMIGVGFRGFITVLFHSHIFQLCFRVCCML